MNRHQVVEQLPALRRYARVLTGDAWAADDLVQDTLERACSKWLLWRNGSDLRAWLFTLMHNLYLNQLRTQPQLPHTDIDDLHDTLQANTSMGDAALDLERCLQRLPPEQRAVLLLVTVEDMDYGDTARILGIRVGTVMSRLSRARSRLRLLMEDAPLASPKAAVPHAAADAERTPPALRTGQPPTLRRLK